MPDRAAALPASRVPAIGGLKSSGSSAGAALGGDNVTSPAASAGAQALLPSKGASLGRTIRLPADIGCSRETLGSKRLLVPARTLVCASRKEPGNAVRTWWQPFL